MIDTRVVLMARARREIREATGWYRKEGGVALAQRWAAAVESALRHLGAHPHAGALRYADMLKISALRFWPIKGFPYLVFYREGEAQIEIWRVLHAQRDIPAWMGGLE